MAEWKLSNFIVRCPYCLAKLPRRGIRGLTFKFECDFCRKRFDVYFPMRDEKQNKMCWSADAEMKILQNLFEGKEKGEITNENRSFTNEN